jgi:hypothetical protein
MNHRIALAIGNLIPALVLGLGCYALPLRWWGMDVPVAVVVLAVLASSAVALRNERLAPRALKLAALALLVLGLALVAAFGLSVAFLAGIHGAFGTFGRLLMVLVLFLLAPYTVVYPAFQLWLLGRATSTKAVGKGPALEAEPSEANASVAASASGAAP